MAAGSALAARSYRSKQNKLEEEAESGITDEVLYEKWLVATCKVTRTNWLFRRQGLTQMTTAMGQRPMVRGHVESLKERMKAAPYVQLPAGSLLVLDMNQREARDFLAEYQRDHGGTVADPVPIDVSEGSGALHKWWIYSGQHGQA